MKFTAPVVAVLVALVLTIAFWFLLYKPASEQQALVEAETATLAQQQQSLQAQIAQLRDIEARQVEIRAAMARLEEFIPTGAAQPNAIRQFQRAADAAGTQISSVTFGPPTAAVPGGDTGQPGTSLASIPITMTVEGGYFQLVDFFRRLEVDVPRAVLVQSMSVTEGEAQFPTLAASWNGQMFGIASDADLGVAAPVTPAPTASPTPAAGES